MTIFGQYLYEIGTTFGNIFSIFKEYLDDIETIFWYVDNIWTIFTKSLDNISMKLVEVGVEAKLGNKQTAS